MATAAKMAFIHKLGLNKVFRVFNPLVEPIVNMNAKKRLAKCCNTWELREAARGRS